jgi:hypothetical protein
VGKAAAAVKTSTDIQTRAQATTVDELLETIQKDVASSRWGHREGGGREKGRALPMNLREGGERERERKKERERERERERENLDERKRERKYSRSGRMGMIFSGANVCGESHAFTQPSGSATFSFSFFFFVFLRREEHLAVVDQQERRFHRHSPKGLLLTLFILFVKSLSAIVSILSSPHSPFPMDRFLMVPLRKSLRIRVGFKPTLLTAAMGKRGLPPLPPLLTPHTCHDLSPLSLLLLLQLLLLLWNAFSLRLKKRPFYIREAS